MSWQEVVLELHHGPIFYPYTTPPAGVSRSVTKSHNEVSQTGVSPPHTQCAGSTVIELHITRFFQEVPATETLPNFKLTFK